MTDDSASLADTVAQLSARVTALEDAAARRDTSPSTLPSTSVTPTDTFWALEGLKARTDDRADGDDSSNTSEVMLVGAVTTADGPVEWQEGRGASALLDTDWSDQAASFAALGHPVRLELLRHILNGTHRTADLAALSDLGTTGQLHHHLRQLVAVGWVRQAGRGAYEIPTARVVPLLACLAGAGA